MTGRTLGVLLTRDLGACRGRLCTSWKGIMVPDMRHAVRCLVWSALFGLAAGEAAVACSLPAKADELTHGLALQINAERIRQGLPEFRSSEVLGEVAQRHACDNASQNRLSHIGSDGSSPGVRVMRLGYDFRQITENVAIGYATPDLVLRAWLASSSHRQNIIDARTTELGLAVAVGRDGRIHWVMNGGMR